MTGGMDAAALKDLTRRSDLKGLTQLLGHGAALGASGLLIAETAGSLWVAPALLVHGVILSFLFAPLHETIHRTAFRSRRLNDALAKICGAAMLLPPVYFRAFHFAHHRHTQNPARDPELAVPKPSALAGYLLLASGLPYWRERIATLARHALGRVDEAFITPRLRPAIRREAQVLLLVYGMVAAISLATASWAPEPYWAMSHWAVLYWLGPLVLGQPALRLALLAEHGGCPLRPEMLLNSRTTRSCWPLRRLLWNMPFHAEHHAYPALPFYALPAAHLVLRDRIAVRSRGYLAAQRDILARLGEPGRVHKAL